MIDMEETKIKEIPEKEILVERRAFMKPGRTNKEDRINFVKFWANYIKTHSDKEWSEQQNIIINSQM